MSTQHLSQKFIMLAIMETAFITALVAAQLHNAHASVALAGGCHRDGHSSASGHAQNCSGV